MVPIWVKNSIKQVLEDATNRKIKAEIKEDIKALQKEGELPKKEETIVAPPAPVAEAKKEEPIVVATAPTADTTVTAPVVEAKKEETIVVPTPIVEDPAIKANKEKIEKIVANAKLRKQVKNIAKKVDAKLEENKRVEVLKEKIEARKKSKKEKMEKEEKEKKDGKKKNKKVMGKEELLSSLKLRAKIKESLQKRALLAKIKEKRNALEAKKNIDSKKMEVRKDIIKKIKSNKTVETIVSKMEDKLGVKKK